MPKQITPYIVQYYDDTEIWQIINENAHIKQQFNEPDIINNQVCVVLPLVYRWPGYARNQFDLYLFIKHNQITELGRLELYRVIDFIRQKVDVSPVIQTAHLVAGVDSIRLLESIKKQIKFLQQAENQALPVAPAQMLNFNN
jgi:MerR family transcriptional regulator, heat shock protein HspR